MRTQRIQAARTRGDLAVITRDLVAPTQTDLGRALDPSTVQSSRVGSIRPVTPTIDLSGLGRRVRLFVLIAVAAVLASCVLGLAAFIPAVVTGFKRDVSHTEAPTSAPSPQASRDVATADTPSLHTASGWTALVEAIKAESGTTEVYDLIAYPQYASVGLDGKDAVDRRFYRNGGWQESVSVRTPISGSPVDLAEIDPDVMARLPGETARHFGIKGPTEAYLVVHAFAGDPRILVYVQAGGQSQYRAYSLDGQPRD